MELCVELGSDLQRPTLQNRAVHVHLQVLTTLGFLATGSFQREYSLSSVRTLALLAAASRCSNLFQPVPFLPDELPSAFANKSTTYLDYSPKNIRTAPHFNAGWDRYPRHELARLANQRRLHWASRIAATSLLNFHPTQVFPLVLITLLQHLDFHLQQFTSIHLQDLPFFSAPAMVFRYTPTELHRLIPTLPPPAELLDSLRHFALLRRPPYVHRGSRRGFIYTTSGVNSIPALWTDSSHAGSSASSLRHHNSTRHQNTSSVNFFNLLTIQTTPSTAFKQKHLKIALFNTRSLNNKSLILNEFITDNKLDLLCLNETWQKPLDYYSLNQTTPAGYSYLDNPRTEGRGGGIAAIFNQNLKPRALSLPSAPSFEHLVFKLPGPKPLITAIIYRPPKPNPSFLSDLSDFTTTLFSISSSILLLGDFNLHIDSPDCKHAMDFLDFLTCSSFTQHTNFPTHNRGHILDLVCSTGLHIHNMSSVDLTISDHLAIIFDIDIPTPDPKQNRKITFRNLKSICPVTLSTCISNSLSCSTLPENPTPTDLVNTYNNILSTSLNTLAPLKTKTVTFSHSAPWFNPALHKLKKHLRQLERLCKKTGLAVHTLAYKDHMQHYKLALNKARSNYYSAIIHSGSSNPRSLFSTINKLLKPHDNTPSSFTPEKCDLLLAFFNSKTETIHHLLASSTTLQPEPTFSFSPPDTQLSTFSPITSADLSKILSTMKSSSSPLDPMPSQLVKDCFTPLAPLITDIINSSLTSGTVPSPLKLAAITPLLKKPGIGPEDLNNYRPISNLTFLSKLLERAVANQLKIHLLSNNLYETFQSGFRTHHSTETALLKVINDLLLSSDSGSLTILLLLDLSAAFDTVKHSILLNRLESIGITNTALAWFKSYLSDRFQYITINQHKSHTIPVVHGVPQGSVLGPILFILYILPLGLIIRRHGLKFHCYADDTQLYITTKTISPAILTTLTCCLTDIKNWMTHNFLKLNSNKTEIIIFGPKSSLPTCQNLTLDIDGHSVTPSPLVRNLGIYMDPTLSFKSHINHVVKTSFFHLRNIARLRSTLPTSAAETLVHAFITSRLDYCNSILYGLPSSVLQKPQYVQNSAARLLTGSPSRQHITPVLRQLHWLPIKQRIHFKILLFTYKALNNLAPSYLSDLLHRHAPTRKLRSADANLLTPTTSTKHRSIGDRAFAIAAPTLWNSLPLTIRNSDSLHSFKHNLKTHLFQSAYNT
ncbi:uncharacterized protein LOC143486075 [Brachyhypopomus gauderio]|uniref:uncharacterized protein LOC143486075 n=1 Tax=Brachyhypopomus gauderio TaxID=698409 RepID=UPI0040422C1B